MSWRTINASRRLVDNGRRVRVDCSAQSNAADDSRSADRRIPRRAGAPHPERERARPPSAEALSAAEIGIDVELLPSVLRPGVFRTEPDGARTASMLCPVCGNSPLIIRTMRANIAGYEFGMRTGAQCSGDGLADDRRAYVEVTLACPLEHEVVLVVETEALPAGVRVIATAEG